MKNKLSCIAACKSLILKNAKQKYICFRAMFDVYV